MRTHAQEKTKHVVDSVFFVFSCASFQTAPYPFKPAVGVVEGRALHCGYLTVPEDHSRPQGPTIRLAVAIFKASYTNPAPDPVVYLEGGPGGPVLAHLAPSSRRATSPASGRGP